MTLVVKRMFGAISGFISKHGAWPTKMVVPVENWTAYERDGKRPDHDDTEVARAALARLDLVPVPYLLYIALDDEGRWFDYGTDHNLSDNWWKSVRDTLIADGFLAANGSPDGDHAQNHWGHALPNTD